MKKLNWSLYKTLQFMNSKRIDFEIRAYFLKQLLAFEQRLFKETYCSKDWEGNPRSSLGVDLSEFGLALVVRNTYLNSIKNEINLEKHTSPMFHSPAGKVKWKDDLVTYIDADSSSPSQKQ